MIVSDIQRDCSIVVLDSKGELTNFVRSLALGDRLIVIDPDEPFAINPLDVTSTGDDVISTLSYMMSGLLETNVTPKQRTFFDTLLQAILHFPTPSLILVWDILTKGPKAYQTQIDQLPDHYQSFFWHEWSSYQDTVREVQWRLRGLLNRKTIRTMFSAPKTRFHIGEAMQQGKIVVIDNSQVKCTKEGCGFIGRLFISQIWAAGTARHLLPEHERKPTYVYVDEANIVIKKDEKIAAIIDELRSAKIGLILAHQRVGQIEDPNVRGALANCGIKMMNVGGEEIDYFSKILDIPRERMTNLPQGHFATDIQFERTDIMRVEPFTVPFRTMTPHEEQQLKQRMKDLYGVQTTPTTHEGPRKEPSHEKINLPAEADRPIIPPQTPTGKPHPWRK